MTYPAGMMVNRVRFERRAAVVDEYGNTLSSWQELTTLWAGFKAQRGREAVEAGRLESTSAGTVYVRRSTTALTISPSDRGTFIVGPWGGKTFNIRSVIPSHDSSMIEFVVEEGGAT